MNWEITNKATYFSLRLYDLLFNDYGSHCAETNRKSCLKPLEIPPEASHGSVVVDPLPSRWKSPEIGFWLHRLGLLRPRTVVRERERERKKGEKEQERRK
jgi:hypothetical protein